MYWLYDLVFGFDINSLSIEERYAPLFYLLLFF